MKHEIQNRFKCPTKLWNKFSEKGRIAYNNVRSIKSWIIHNDPDGVITKKDWNTISHNYACFAAWEF